MTEFAPGTPVLVTVYGGFANVPPKRWTSVVRMVTVRGNVIVDDEFGYPLRVTPSCLDRLDPKPVPGTP